MISSKRLGSLLLLGFVLYGCLVSAEEKPATPTPAPVASAMKPAEALKGLKDDNRRFVTEHVETTATGKDRLVELAMGQHPIATIIACADSRVSGIDLTSVRRRKRFSSTAEK